MALTTRERINLLTLAKGHWIEAESNTRAYERVFKAARGSTEIAKAMTLGSAGLTTVIALVGDSNLTAVAGAATTLLALYEKVASPGDKFQKSFECRSGLDEVKQGLTTFSITLAAVEDLIKGAEPLNQFQQKIPMIVQKMPVLPTEEDKIQARKDFERSTIAEMIAQAKEADVPAQAAGLPHDDRDGGAGGPAGATVGLPDDAPGVVAVSRPRAQNLPAAA